jgi:Leucine-rich repeat (LRR) protein
MDDDSDTSLEKCVNRGSIGRVQVIEYKLEWSNIDQDSDDDHDTRRRSVPFPEEVWTFENLKKLKILNCPHETLPSKIGTLKELEALVLVRCDFAELPSSIGQLEKLQRLVIFSCPTMTTFPSEIGRLANLKKLYLRNNKSLEALPPDLNKLTGLETIKLMDQPNLTVPAEVFSSKLLKRFEILRCKRIEFPNSMRHLQKLKRLQLQIFRSCSNVPGDFGDMTNLKKLSIGEGPVSSFPAASIGNLVNLEELDLAGLDLHSLPREIGGMVNLQKLTLERCVNLQSVPSTFDKLTNLESLVINTEWIELVNSLPCIPKLKSLRLWVFTSDQEPAVITVFKEKAWKETGRLESLDIDCKSPLGENYDQIIQGLPRSLRELTLSGYDISGAERLDCIRKLLETYDRLVRVRIDSRPWNNSLPFYESYLLKLNKCGRVLLRSDDDDDRGSKSIPSSVWSTVLARVRPEMQRYWEHPERRDEAEASIIYRLLQGPAFLCRPASGVASQKSI